MSKPKKNHQPPKRAETGAFAAQAITHADDRDPQTRTPLPSDSSVARARDWVQENKK